MKKSLDFALILFLLFLISSCSTYEYKAVPFSLPSSQPEHVSVDGVQISAAAYVSPDYAKEKFGFDIRKAGLLPVQLVIDNQSSEEVTIDPFQTFLIDNMGQAWTILPEQEAYKRIKDFGVVGKTLTNTVRPAAMLSAAGALLGFAVGIVSGHHLERNAASGAVIGATAGALAGGLNAWANAEKEIREDLLARSLKAKSIEPGEIAHGFLFFPGKKEATSARYLRLALRIGGRERIVSVPLTVW